LKSITVSVLVMAAILIGLAGFAYWKDPRLPLEGVKEGGKAFLQILPAMVLAFFAAALIAKLIPTDVMMAWLGNEAGFRGICIGTLAGLLTPGGPFVQFPIVATLYERGVGVGPVVAYLSAWALLGINRLLIFEIPLLGWRLSLCRYAVTLGFPMAIGWMTQQVWNRMT